MARVALIACSNGLGHVRRMILLALQLQERGVEPTLFAPAKSIERFRNYSLNLNSIQTEEHVAALDRETLCGTYGWSWLDKWQTSTQCFDAYDVVVSDNSPEFLAIRPDTIISGNFLWHQICAEIDKAHHGFLSQLFARHRPTMITYGGFSQVVRTEGLREISVSILQPNFTAFSTERKGVLISCGTGGAAQQLFNREIRTMLNDRSIDPEIEFFVEPSISGDLDGFYQVADFSEEMFLHIGCAITRPGFGIISECMRFGIRIFSLYEKDNLEMIRSAEIIARLQVGEDFIGGTKGIEQISSFLRDREQKENQIETIKKLGCAMDLAAADVVMSRLEEGR